MITVAAYESFREGSSTESFLSTSDGGVGEEGSGLVTVEVVRGKGGGEGRDLGLEEVFSGYKNEFLIRL